MQLSTKHTCKLAHSSAILHASLRSPQNCSGRSWKQCQGKDNARASSQISLHLNETNCKKTTRGGNFEKLRKQKMMIFFLEVNWSLLLLLLLAICLSPTVMRAQMLDCNFKEADMLPCLTKTGENTTEACCLALNQTLKLGHNCLCSILSYTNPQLASLSVLLPASPLALTFPGCDLISLSLTDCGVPLELNPLPVPTKEPALTPVATAPVPRPVDSSTNSTQNPVEEPQQERGMPRTSRNLDPPFGYDSYSKSTGARLEIYKSLASWVWFISICMDCVVVFFTWVCETL